MSAFDELQKLQNYFDQGSIAPAAVLLANQITARKRREEDRRYQLDDAARRRAEELDNAARRRSDALSDTENARRYAESQARDNLILGTAQKLGLGNYAKDGKARSAAELEREFPNAAKRKLDVFESQIASTQERSNRLAAQIQETVGKNASPELTKQAVMATLADPSIAPLLSDAQRQALLSGKSTPEEVYTAMSRNYIFRQGKALGQASQFLGRYLEELNSRLGESRKIDVARIANELQALDRERFDTIKEKNDFLQQFGGLLPETVTKAASESNADSKAPEQSPQTTDVNALARQLRDDFKAGRVQIPGLTPGQDKQPNSGESPSQYQGVLPRLGRSVTAGAEEAASDLGLALRPLSMAAGNAYDYLITGKPMLPESAYYSPEERAKLDAHREKLRMSLLPVRPDTTVPQVDPMANPDIFNALKYSGGPFPTLPPVNSGRPQMTRLPGFEPSRRVVEPSKMMGIAPLDSTLPRTTAPDFRLSPKPPAQSVSGLPENEIKRHLQVQFGRDDIEIDDNELEQIKRYAQGRGIAPTAIDRLADNTRNLDMQSYRDLLDLRDEMRAEVDRVKSQNFYIPPASVQPRALVPFTLPQDIPVSYP